MVEYAEDNSKAMNAEKADRLTLNILTARRKQSQEIRMIDHISEENGIMLLKATRRMAELENDGTNIAAVGVVRCELTEAFSILTQNADSDEKTHVFGVLQETSEKIMQDFIAYFSYLLRSREKVKKPFDGKDLEFTFWLNSKNRIHVSISREHIDRYLDEIEVSGETRNIADFIIDATESKSASECTKLLAEINKLISEE